jgi:glycosyltransferase involved in cell wall biosynthesis
LENFTGGMTLRIAIHAELPPGTQAGGTQGALLGLLHALRELDGPEEYRLICHPENRAWLEPVLSKNITLVDRPQPRKPGWREGAQRWFARRLRRLTGEKSRAWPEVARSDGFYESLGAQLIHWPWQHFVVTALPSIFNPHDLLHLHYPQFFQPRDLVARETVYPIACRLAHMVVVGSEWARDDIAGRYAVSASRMQVIPWAPPSTSAAAPGDTEVAAARAKFSLPENFAFYPAVTWEHKNHLRLLAALAELRDQRALVIPLICTGHRFERHAVKVEAEMKRLGLEGQVRFLGSVSFAELRAIYRAAQFVVVPTLFEAASGPVFEAWQEGTPVACSTVTSLPQQAGNAALLFDPYEPHAIAEAVGRMATDATLRDTLRANGRRRLGDFSWERTARAYRAVYRRTAGVTLTSEEKELLAWDWMRDARRPIS